MPKKKCKVICNNRWGYQATPYEAESIAEGVRWAKQSGWWYWVIVVDGKIVRRGHGDE